jgi:UDP-N-acetyl-2-amino-2-deoxyglucuronate dehydrogenase
MFPVIRERNARIATICCGRISKNHFSSIGNHKESRKITAICDIDHEVLVQYV